MAEGINFDVHVVFLQPVHHRCAFSSGFLDVGDRLCAEKTTANSDLVVVNQSFWNRVNVEVLFEVCFFGWEFVVLWVKSFVVNERVNRQGQIILHHFDNQLFHLVCRVECTAVILRKLKNHSDVRFDLQFFARCTRGSGLRFLACLQVCNRSESVGVGFRIHHCQVAVERLFYVGTRRVDVPEGMLREKLSTFRTV